VRTDIERHLNMTTALVSCSPNSQQPSHSIRSHLWTGLISIAFEAANGRIGNCPASLVWLNWLSVTTLLVCVRADWRSMAKRKNTRWR
jgi:hypothetical protein